MADVPRDIGNILERALFQISTQGNVASYDDLGFALGYIQGLRKSDIPRIATLFNKYISFEGAEDYETLRLTFLERKGQVGGATVVKKKKRKLANLKKKSNLNFHSKGDVIKNITKDTKKSATRALNVYKKFLKKNPKDADVQSIVETLERKLNPPVPTRGQVASKIKKMYKK